MGNSEICSCLFFICEDSSYIKKLSQKIQLQPFFQGQILQTRMKHIRQNYINKVRTKYCKQYFQQMKSQLIKILPNLRYTQIIIDDKDQINQVLVSLSKQDLQEIQEIQFFYWDDKKIRKKKQFKAIKALTLQSINCTIIRFFNQLLRGDTIQNQKLFQLGVFFVQCINIQLFLLTLNFPTLKNYQGITYRGFTCNVEDFQQFEKIFKKPMQQRTISVPLSLWSSSKNLQVAEQFLRNRYHRNTVNIILAINVINLPAQDLEKYEKSFPKSILSTICAVDISDNQLHYHPDEQEILLRGAFCQILDIEQIKKYSKQNTKFSRTKEFRGGKLQYKRINCLMVNINRDHISTSFLGQETNPSRQMLTEMVKKARKDFSVQYFKQKQIEKS